MSQILRLSSSNICKSQLNTIFTDAASETIAQLYGCRNCRILRSKRHEIERQGEHTDLHYTPSVTTLILSCPTHSREMSDKFESQHPLTPSIWSDIVGAFGRTWEWIFKDFFIFTFLEVNMSNILWSMCNRARKGSSKVNICHARAQVVRCIGAPHNQKELYNNFELHRLCFFNLFNFNRSF